MQNLTLKTLTLSLIFSFNLKAEEAPAPGLPEGAQAVEKKRIGDLPLEQQQLMTKVIEKVTVQASASVIQSAWRSLMQSKSDEEAVANFGEHLGGPLKDELSSIDNLNKFLGKMGLNKNGTDPALELMGVDYQKVDGEQYKKGQRVQILVHLNYKPYEDNGKITQYRIVLEGPGVVEDDENPSEAKVIQNLDADELVMVSIRSCDANEAASPIEDHILKNKQIDGVKDLEVKVYNIKPPGAPNPETKPKATPKKKGPIYSA